MLARITPGELAVSYRTTGGTESVKGALQIAMAYTGRDKFISLEDSYHNADTWLALKRAGAGRARSLAAFAWQ
jgi:4-aminobutyrate aminotransferase-like enzyme